MGVRRCPWGSGEWRALRLLHQEARLPNPSVKPHLRGGGVRSGVFGTGSGHEGRATWTGISDFIKRPHGDSDKVLSVIQKATTHQTLSLPAPSS
jgi:hypothetical protein